MAFTTLKAPQCKFLEMYLRGTGREMSAKQAAATFGIMNLSARMSEFRQSGLIVRKTINSGGRTAYAVSRRDVIGRQHRIYT